MGLRSCTEKSRKKIPLMKNEPDVIRQSNLSRGVI